MAFPEDKLDRRVLIFRNGAWEFVTQYVYQRNPIVISRGSGAERATTRPAQCNLTLDNRDARWSRRAQSSPWFGTIGRNLVLAVQVAHGDRYLGLSSSTANYIRTPDAAALSIAGDFDVRIDLHLLNWRKQTDLGGQWGATIAWYLQLNADGTLRLTWSTDGTTPTFADSTIPVPWPQANRAAVRATLDVNNGAGGWTVTFWWSQSQGVEGPWMQLGDAVVTTAGVTSVFNSADDVNFGSLSGSFLIQEGRLYAAQLRNGIGGTVVANPDVRAATAGAASFVDSTGKTWTPSGGSITNVRTEFVGELADLPLEQDVSGNDCWVPATATGITRRLGQGQRALPSTLRRALPSIGTNLRAYWPLEDGADSASGASAVTRGQAMLWGSPAPQLAAYSGFAGSAPIPTMNGAIVRGAIAAYPSSGVVQLRFLLSVPAGGAANNSVIVRLLTGGTAAQWDLIYTTGGALTLTAFDASGTSLGSLGPFAFAVDGRPLMVSIELSTTAGNTSRTISTVDPGDFTGSTSSSTLVGSTVTTARQVILNANRGLTDTAIGHVTVESAITDLFTFGQPLAAWTGERAGRRVERLCAEAGISFVQLGDLDDSEVMGPQGQQTLLALLRECEATDGGILAEPRDRLGITYKPRSALYTPGTFLTLDGGGGTGGDLSAITPVDDDQMTRNDVQVSRPNGSSYRAVAETGPLSTASFPNGVGVYDDAVTVNVRDDSQLPDQAGWRLHLGTIDEARYPLIEAHLSRRALVTDTTATTAALEADLGDSLSVTNPPRRIAERTTIRQGIVNRLARLGSHEYVVQWVGQPASAYDVVTLDYEYPGEESRLSSDGTEVDGAHVVGATTLKTLTPSGPLWGHADGDFTIRIVETGEQMTVTAVTTTSATKQDFTVTRGVNGTTAVALTGGETIELARPVYWGL